MRKIVVILSMFLSLSLVFAPGVVAIATEQEKTDIIAYGTIIEEDNVGVNATSNEYTIEEIAPEITTYDTGNNEQEISNYNSPVKIEEEAGTHVINYNNETSTIEYNSETNKLVSKTEGTTGISAQAENPDSEYFTVENGVITSASEANIITIGGAETINYMYPTIEDAYNQTNGVTISGGAEYGSYSETITYEDKDFVYVTISGFEGYMYLEDVQIIPSYINMNTSYYFTEDDIWYFASATDPLVSNEYMVMPLSDAPEWAEEDVKYYSNDTETFTVDEYMAPETYTDYQNAAYFQNLSLRSTTSYTGSQLKSFLTYKGKSASQYYNSTQAFIDAQNEFGVNGLLLFSMANLEGAYGTSHYSTLCNNFFGRGAYDSDPDQACAGRDFPQPEDGIMAQAIFLSINFMDQADWRYEGSYVGSKAGGLNVHYASDPNWGQSIASLAYECDKYLGGKDNNYFKIVEIKGDVPVYTTSAMTTKARAQGAYMCNSSGTQCIDPDNPNSYVDYYIGRQTTMPVRVVVTGETENAYEIQVETPKNQGSSGFVTWTYAETGNYPNYEGSNHGASGQPDENYVSSGYINFANDYGKMSANQFWIPKTYNGNATTTTVANNPIKDTQRTVSYSSCNTFVSSSVDSNGNTVKVEKASDGSKKCTTTYKGTSSTKIKRVEENYYNNDMLEKVYYYYNSSGKLYNREYYKYDSSGRKTYYADTNYNTSNGNITDYKEYYYNSSGQRTQRNEKYYYSNGEAKTFAKYYYNSSNKLYNREYYKYDDKGRKTYYADTNYSTSSGKITDYKEYYYNTSGERTQRNEKYYYSNGQPKTLTKYYYNSSNKLYNRDYYKYDDKGRKTYFSDTNYNTSTGNISNYIEYYYNTSGVRIQRNEKYYYSDGSPNYKVNYYYNSNGDYVRKETVTY